MSSADMFWNVHHFILPAKDPLDLDWVCPVKMKETKYLTALLVVGQNDIKKSPAFRAQFHTMCQNIGVDPLASRKGFWAELLGIGDFYYELGQ